MNINLNQNTSYAKSFRHKSIFLHMVLTALCFCIAIVTIFIFLWLYTEYNNLKDNYRASGENLLLQTSKTMDLTLDQSITGMNSLLYCQDVIRGSVANRLMTGADTVSLLSLLSSNCSTLESVDYIGYYVLTADKAYDSNQNISSLEEAPKIPILRHYLEHGDNITRIQKDTITCDILIYEDTIYLFQSYPGLLYDSQSYLMFELNPEYMSQVISQKESDVPMEIYDHSGNHILSNRATQNAPIADEIKSRIFSTTDHFGYIHASTDSDTDSDVFYLKTKQGWIYLYASPTETLLQTLISVFGSRAFLLLGALLFASLFLSLNLSQKVYRPIRTLVDAVSPVQTDPSIDQADNEVDYLNRAYDSMLSYRTRMQKSLPAIQNAVHEKLFQRILK